MQDLPAPGRIFGAVEIDTNHERRAARRLRERNPVHLQIQPGRDRLHDMMRLPAPRSGSLFGRLLCKSLPSVYLEALERSDRANRRRTS